MTGMFLMLAAIWAGDGHYVTFSAAFDRGESEDAVLRISGSSAYRVRVNGDFAWYGPARGPRGYARRDEVPLAPFLHAGKNDLEIEVANYAVNNYQYLNEPAFLAAEVKSGKKTLVSEDDFRAVRTPRKEGTAKFTIQRPWREERDVSSAKGEPIPVRQVPAPKFLSRRVGAPDFSLNASAAPRQFTVADGGSQVVAFDVNESGFVAATVKTKGPVDVTLTFDERLTKGDVDADRLYQGGNVVWHIREAGTWKLETFDPYTLKYAKWSVAGGEAEFRDLFIRRYASAAVVKKGDPNDMSPLARIRRAAIRTFEQNAVDVMTDCPSRERAGWIGDSLFTARAAFHLTGTLYTELVFLENYEKAESFPNIPTGMVPMCYPSDGLRKKWPCAEGMMSTFIPNFAMFFVLQVEEYLGRGGDPEVVERMRPRVKGVIDYLARFENEDGLLEKLPGWVFVEWSKASEYVQDVNYPSNMLWAEALDAAARTYSWPELAAKAAYVRETIRKQSYRNGVFVDHAVRTKDGALEIRPEATETCQYYAFAFGTATPQLHPALWKRLVAGDVGDLSPSALIFGKMLRFDLLRRAGLGEQLLKEIEREFLPMADETGTLWEHSKPTASCCHGLTSYIAVLIDGVRKDLSTGTNLPVPGCVLEKTSPERSSSIR